MQYKTLWMHSSLTLWLSLTVLGCTTMGQSQAREKFECENLVGLWKAKMELRSAFDTNYRTYSLEDKENYRRKDDAITDAYRLYVGYFLFNEKDDVTPCKIDDTLTQVINLFQAHPLNSEEWEEFITRLLVIENCFPALWEFERIVLKDNETQSKWIEKYTHFPGFLAINGAVLAIRENEEISSAFFRESILSADGYIAQYIFDTLADMLKQDPVQFLHLVRGSDYFAEWTMSIFSYLEETTSSKEIEDTKELYERYGNDPSATWVVSELDEIIEGFQK